MEIRLCPHLHLDQESPSVAVLAVDVEKRLAFLLCQSQPLSRKILQTHDLQPEQSVQQRHQQVLALTLRSKHNLESHITCKISKLLLSHLHGFSILDASANLFKILHNDKMLMGMVRPIKISSFLPHTPAKIPLVKMNSNIGDADFSFSYQDLMFFITHHHHIPCSTAHCALLSTTKAAPKDGFVMKLLIVVD